VPEIIFRRPQRVEQLAEQQRAGQVADGEHQAVLANEVSV
jgi:hypothetical protein